MAWRCVAVRAGEPGGGALLQHCATPRSHGHALYNTLLPIMPLCGPASPTEPIQPESKNIQQTVPLTSMPPADASAAPPPGLIAPLSPRLAEEQEEDDGEGSLKQEISDGPVLVNKQSTVTVETKKKRKREGEQPVWPTPRISINLQRRSMRRRTSYGKKINRSEERRNVRIKTQDRRRNIQTGHVEAQRKHTRAEEGEDKTMEAEKENEKFNEVMKKRRRRRRRSSKELDGLTPVKMNSEVMDRPRRKAVGPPIRYLLEYEERSHGKSVANCRKGGGLRGEEEKGRKEEVELQERSNSSREVGGGMALKQLHLSIYRKGSRRRGTTILRLRRLHYYNIRSRHRRNTAVPSSPQSLCKPEKEDKGERRDVEKKRPMEEVGEMVRNRQRSRRQEHEKVARRRRGREKLEEKLAQRPRRMMVGPPIRYLLESEEKTSGQEIANQDVEKGNGGVTKPQKKKTGSDNKASDDRTKTTELTEKQMKSTHQDAACSPKRRVGRTKLVRVDSESVGGASGVTNLTGGTRRERQRLRQKRQTERRSGDLKVELEGGEKEREEEVKESPKRPRRMMAGPPIRYLLESEEKTHGQETAKQNVAKGIGGVTKPQKKNTGPEGEALDDRTITSELTEKHMKSTNQDAACSPKRRVRRPKMVGVDSESVGGVTNLTGGTRRERQRLEWKRQRDGRSRDQKVKLEGVEGEREEEVKESPQRQRRTLVGPPIRYLLESEEKTNGQEIAQQNISKGAGGVTKQQKKNTGPVGRASDDSTITTDLTEKQMKSTNQDVACSPNCKMGRPEKVRVDSEAVGGASGVTNLAGGTRRERRRLNREEQSENRSGDWKVKLEGGEEERKEEVKESPQRQRRTVVGPPIGYLLESEEQSHDWKVPGTGWEPNPQEKSKSGNRPLKQEAAMIDRPEDTEQKVRQTGKTDKEMRTSLINPDRPKGRRRRPLKVSGLSEEGGGASEMTDRTEVDGHKGTRRRGRKRKRGTEEGEVREVCVNDRGEDKMEEDRKEKQTESPKRPRRTMVGPPIRYLLESEEQSHGWDTTNQGFGCIRKMLKGNEARGGTVEDIERTKHEAGIPEKVRDDSKTGESTSERQTDIWTQTGPHTQSDLIYFDPSGQVTIFSPCCVRLQRLL